MNKSKQRLSETALQELATQFRESYMTKSTTSYHPRKAHLSKNQGTAECPACHEHAYGVIESRSLKDQTRRRRRYCHSCHYRATTYEITADQYQEYSRVKEIWDSLKMEMNTLETVINNFKRLGESQ